MQSHWCSQMSNQRYKLKKIVPWVGFAFLDSYKLNQPLGPLRLSLRVGSFCTFSNFYPEKFRPSAPGWESVFSTATEESKPIFQSLFYKQSEVHPLPFTGLSHTASHTKGQSGVMFSARNLSCLVIAFSRFLAFESLAQISQ
jgi:hypothetical protein